MEKAVIYCAGGHAKVIYDILQLTEGVEVVGFIDDTQDPGTAFLDSTILGGKDNLESLIEQYNITCGIVALAGVTGANQKREEFNGLLREKGLKIIGARHPSAVISPYAQVHETAQICGMVWIGPSSEIGEGCIINTGAQIDHDNHIGKYVHIAPGVKLMGFVTVGDYSYVGASSTVKEKLTVGKETLVAMGSLVIQDVANKTRVQGHPAREYVSK